MFKVFTLLADLIVYTWLKLPEGSKWAGSVHFFIEDVTKIFFLLVVMIYVIGLLRAGLNTERIRVFLQGKKSFLWIFFGCGVRCRDAFLLLFKYPFVSRIYSSTDPYRHHDVVFDHISHY